jgi:hypothetical protein
MTTRGQRFIARTAATAGVVVVAAGLAACGGSGGGAKATTTVTQTAAASSSTASPTATASSSAAAASTATSSAAAAAPAPTKAKTAGNGTVPDYKPSSVVSKRLHATVLRSPDSVTKIGTFYSGALAKGGWTLRASSKSSYHANFTAHRANEGVNISVYPRGSGSGITINQHPE